MIQKRFYHTLSTKNFKSVTVPNKLLINGEWVNATGNKTFDTVNPATGEVICSVASAQKEDVEKAVQAAEDATKEWRKVSPAARAQMMNKLAEKMEVHKDELALIETTDQGKPLAQAYQDVLMSAGLLRYYAGACARIQGHSINKDFTNQTVYTRKEPLGVVATITPWNFPLLLHTLKLAPIFASGCTGIFKISENAPLSALKQAELLSEVAGVLPGVVNLVPGYGKEAGEAIINHPKIKKVAFTGSTAVGRHILSTSGKTLQQTSLELGGKSPLLCFADANLDKFAGTAVFAGTTNAGQFCAAPTRILVQESVYDEVVGKMIYLMQSLKIGEGTEAGVQLGPVNSKAQFDKVLSYITHGEKVDGAKVLTGGKQLDRAGFFVQPTLFAAKQGMKIVREEIFGPVLTVQSFKDIDEALYLANDNEYGLASGAFSTNTHTLNRCERELDAGYFFANNWFAIDTHAPFGGFKQSGIGKEFGAEGLENYLKTKSVSYDHN